MLLSYIVISFDIQAREWVNFHVLYSSFLKMVNFSVKVLVLNGSERINTPLIIFKLEFFTRNRFKWKYWIIFERAKP
jgi:hypothetical protein